MTPAQAIALIGALTAALVAVSAMAGALWWRSRTLPILRAAQLARELIERQRALEAIIERLDVSGKSRPSHPAGPAPASLSSSHRFDPPQLNAVAGPTLITVPDLSAPPTEPSVATVEMAQRFGPIWELAELGESAEAIVRATGQPIGQVELVLGLRRQLTLAERRV